jgi:hypothetical protein
MIVDAAKLEASQAILDAGVAVRHAREMSGAGSTAAGLAVGGLAAAGVLAADDVTVVGVADDVLIPAALLFAAGAGIVAAAQSNSAADKAAAVQAASQQVASAIETLGLILMAAKVGEKVRSITTQLQIHLARILSAPVGGMPPDHQQDPERDRNHWWTEIVNFVRQVRDQGLSPKQLGRELSKKFTKEQLDAIVAAIKKAAELVGKDPPDFPPVAFP